ncbi:tyrosine-type recombinase/integrase [Salicibibacter cibi]|nr:site-specific integrase [Salicibibacter cibi]
MHQQAPIEEIITDQSTLIEALEVMKEYKFWSDSTLEGYQSDAQCFENFLCDRGLDPTLQNGRLDYVQKWIKEQKDGGVSASTMKRRTTALSSLFSFYRDLGIVGKNPFKVITLPVGQAGHHSPILTLDQLREVYQYAEGLQKEGHPAAMTIKALIFTGLRNEALSSLTVKSIHVDKKWLKYERAYINSKNKVQIIPLPPKLLSELQAHIHMHHLQADDLLLLD